jgi:alkaline phosphatase
VLVIHNAHIAWEAGKGNKQNTLAEILDSDSLLGRVLDMVSPDNRTLVLVLSGFETGGASVQGNAFSKNDPALKFNTSQNTAVYVPVFANGPGAYLFSGLYNNIDIFLKLKSLIE